MEEGFTKLYSTILDSSVWGESKDVKILWVTMLAMTKQHGRVEASVGGLARRAGLTREECEAALAVLSAPDPDDRSGVDEGRRIRKADGGWVVTNHKRYRDFRTDKQAQDAERQQRKRERDRLASHVTERDVTPSPVTSQEVAIDTESESEAETDPEQTPPPMDLTGSAQLPEAVVVPRNAEQRISCPADLRLTVDQRMQFQQGTGASDYQVDQLELRFRMASGTAATRNRAAWQSSIGKAVAAEFSNGRRRPPASPDAESGTHLAARLRHGPRQPNAADHTTLSDEEHLSRIGGTSA